jgi:hypothetical protein
MFPQALIRDDDGKVTVYGGSNRITIRKMFDTDRKELTDNISLINTL